jgi:hypothetical protein
MRHAASTRGVGWWLLVAWAAVVGMGCEDDVIESQGHRGAAGDAPAMEVQPRESPYGPDGELRESDQVIAGLPLPMGLERTHGEDRRHVYRTDLPLRALQRYFGPRLLTGQVDRMGRGAVYRGAVPRGVQGGAVKLDVSILPVTSGTRVEIVEIRPPPESPPTVEELRRWARDQQWQ